MNKPAKPEGFIYCFFYRSRRTDYVKPSRSNWGCNFLHPGTRFCPYVCILYLCALQFVSERQWTQLRPYWKISPKLLRIGRYHSHILPVKEKAWFSRLLPLVAEWRKAVDFDVFTPCFGEAIDKHNWKISINYTPHEALNSLFVTFLSQ